VNECQSIGMPCLKVFKINLTAADITAISDRCLPLIITIVIEIPVLLMISGGSGRLCALIGRSRYQLLMAFLPLSSAISGNCGAYS
jgi:hypothetical protein